MENFSKFRQLFAGTFLTIMLASLSATASVCNWTNTAGGNWSNPLNWSPNQVPGTADTAVITLPGTYNVLLDIDATVAGLNLGAATVGSTQSLSTGARDLTVSGPVDVSPQGQFSVNGGGFGGNSILEGTLNWSGGSLAGVLTVASNSVLNILAGGGDGFSGLTLTNYGTVNWSNTTLYGINGGNAQIYNYGTWNAQSDNEFQGAYNGGESLFVNWGTFLKSGSSNTTVLDGNVNFDNYGTVEATNGTLNLMGGGTSDGGGAVTSGAGEINFDGFVFTNTNSFAGTGSYVRGAVFAGTTLGVFNWDGGSLSGTLTLPSNSVLNIVAGGGDGLSGLTLSNYGTVNWSNTTIYGINGGNARIYNYGTWNAQSDNQFQGGYNGATTLFENYGTFAKSGGTNTTILDGNVVFDNSGLVTVAGGTVDLGGGASSGGQFAAASGASINFTSSPYVFSNLTTFSGSVSTLGDGATFAGTIAGPLAWAGGSLTGTLTLASNGVLNIVAGGGDGLSGLTLSNYGTVNWSNTTLYGINGGNARIYNYGTWNAQSDNQFQGGYNGGTTLFDNFGMFVKTGHAGTTTLDGRLVFNNSGTVLAESGTLSINGGGVNSGSGTFGTVNGAYLELAGIDFSDSTAIGGNTVVELGGNTVVNGVLSATNLQLTGGVLSGTNVLEGTLTWSGGSLAGVLTVASNSVLNIVAGGGDGFDGLLLTNYGTVNWSNTTLYGINGGNAQIYNYGTWNAQSDNEFQGAYNGGRSSFVNWGTFLKSGGSNTTVLDGNVNFDNYGTVAATNGTLNLMGGGTSDGGGAVTSGAGEINFDGFVFTNTNSFAGTGSYLTGAVFAGTTLGVFNWDGGSLSGTLTLPSNSVLNIVAGGGDGLSGLTLSNYGTVNWSNTTLYGINGGNARIYNYGTWNAQSDNQFQGGYNGGTTLFENYGTFAKSGGTNTTILDGNVVFNSTGTLALGSGTLSLRNYTLSGSLEFDINSQSNYGTLALAGSQGLSGIPVSVNFPDGFVPAVDSQFALVSAAHLTGAFATTSLPYGMSFDYSSQSASLTFSGITQATWTAGASGLHGASSVVFLLSPGTTVELVALSPGGASTVLGSTTGSGLSSLLFDTTKLSNSPYSLQAVVSNAAGLVGTFSRNVFVNNALSWHEGVLASDETWGTTAVNAVDQTVIVPNGVTLTIAPGAMVKFAPGTGIIVEAGGTLDASGATAAAPIILTALTDDSVGGDSDEDNGTTLPEPGDWDGVSNLGQFKSNPFVQLRYVIQTVGGVISANQEWPGAMEYHVTANVTVPSNVVLTVAPGAIVKFDPGLNITVEAGGTLIATGTVAQPIIFTSINDQSVGAVTNGALTTPSAGDWDSIYLSGGQAIFDHVTLSYGGGPDSLNSGLISLTAPGAVVSVSDSIISQSLYRGIQAEYGTVNVTNCLVTGCDRGIQPGLSGPTQVNIVNCTIDNNNYGVLAHGGAVNIANSIISDNLSAGVEYCCGSSMGLFDHNDVWSATGGNYAGASDQTGLNGNISANPQFVNAAQGNYELNYGSPCINAADGAVAPLRDMLGAPGYNYPGIAHPTGTINADGIYPDMGAYEFSANAPSDVDLIANGVIGPTQVTAGQAVTVQWNDVNIGSGQATGPWHDTVSLVAVNGGDPVAGTVLVAQQTVLGPGQSYPASAMVIVPAGVEGLYRWEVQVNSQGDVFEGSNWLNNTALALATTTLADPMLNIGGSAASGQFTAAGQSSVFAVESQGGTFVLNAQGNSPHSALQLLVGDGFVPDSSHFNFESSQFDSPSVSATVPSANHDTYYVVVNALSLDASTVGFSITASPLTFALSAVSPATVANDGPVTLQVSGNELVSTDTYTLVGPGGSLAAVSVQATDPTVAYAVFDLAGLAAGNYSLTVRQPGGASLTLTNAVTVNSAPPAVPAFSVHLELPSVFRRGRTFIGTIVYENTGNVDMPAPLLFLSSGGAAQIALAGKTNLTTGNLAVLAVSFDGPAGTLTPGKTWSVPFTALSTSSGTRFSLGYLTAAATNQINYSALQSQVQPKGYSAAVWNAIWAKFQSRAGTTWGGLVSLLDSDATEMQDDEDSNGPDMANNNDEDEPASVDDDLGWEFGVDDGGYADDGGDDDDTMPSDPDSPGDLDDLSVYDIDAVSSGDPNAKFATGVGASQWVAADDTITYTIDFANETNASAPAQIVTIRDGLATNLNWSTLQLTSVSFNNAALNIPAGVQSFATTASVGTDPNPVEVNVSLNPTNGLLTCVLQSINPVTGKLVTDPLAGFLPPDNAAGQGEGSITYTIAPAAGLSTGAQIMNQASIVFDVNAPITTPTTTNTIDATPPTSSISPLPATSTPAFEVSWSGQDVGSGIAGYDIYVSNNGGPWTAWLVGATNTSALYTGVVANSYAFYSVAFDEVGNAQINPTIPGATTTTAGTVVTPVPINVARSAGGNLTLTWSQGTLLAATNLAGPWNSTTAVSPYTVAPTNSQMYFKLLEN